MSLKYRCVNIDKAILLILMFYPMVTQWLPNFLGKGQIGSWKKYFTPELSAKFESEILLKLEGTGLHFDFGH